MPRAISSSPTGRKRGPAPSLTLEQIVAAALHLIDTGGIAALTTRRLAQEMNVGAMTLYSYVRTKEELLDRVVDSALGAMVPCPDPVLGWAGNLAAATRAIRLRLVERPGTLEIMLAARNVSASSLDPAREHMLAPLLEAGFSTRSAVEAVSAAQTYAFGFALAQRSHSHMTTSGNGRGRELDPADYPSLSKVADEYADRFSDQAFEEGLSKLIGRIELDHEV
jgi:AcrR family transcriptional regulator